MKHYRSCRLLDIALLSVVCAFSSCGRSQSHLPVGRGRLQDAVKARTEVTVLRQEVAAAGLEKAFGELRGEGKSPQVLQAMRKIVARAEGKQEEGNILLTKDRYGDALQAYQESAKLYRQALDWRKVRKELIKVERGVIVARTLAEAVAKQEEMETAKALQISAEGYLEAGEVDRAMAEYDKARKAYEVLIPGEGTATMEQTVMARTAMQAARDQIKNAHILSASAGLPSRRMGGTVGEGDETSPTEKGPKPGSMADLLNRARKAELSASEAMEERQYTPARVLFAAAEELYREAGVLQTRREQAHTSRKAAEDSMKLADSAFKSSSRPVSFERGKLALADAHKALADDDVESAKKLLATAAEQFAVARSEAQKVNQLAEARDAWFAAMAASDEDMLKRHVPVEFMAARDKAGDAQEKAAAGQTEAAAVQYKAAGAALNEAAANARTWENAVKTEPTVKRLKVAIDAKDKFGAEDVLAELETLIPTDARMASFRGKVDTIPGPKRQLSLDLGKGVKMDFVLIRPGAFTMGSDKGEKPVHKVRITSAFYMAKYEVTQEQWETIMGSNPSTFKGEKNLPVEQVSWYECQDFLKKLGAMVNPSAFADRLRRQDGNRFRLPSEAEWEYACRAGSVTEYCFGDSDNGVAEYAWFFDNSGQKTHPVGQKKPNAWGLYDMHGNVWEWCADSYGQYPEGEQTDPAVASSGPGRDLRGGSWVGYAGRCRSAFRSYSDPVNRGSNVGLRPVAVVR